MSLSDLAIIIVLILLVPRVVEKNLTKLDFGRELRMLVMLGGVIWIVESFSHHFIYAFLDIVDADAEQFKIFAYQWTVKALESGDYATVINQFFYPGRGFYVTYQGLFYYFGSTTVVSILAINAFMAFWGSLTLTRLIYSFYPSCKFGGFVLPLFLIFTPSVVFWSSSNIKEALLYWAICQVFAFIMPTRGKYYLNFILFVIGAFLGFLLRPAMMLPWVVSVLFAKMLRGTFWKYGMVFILLCPLLLGLFVRGKTFNRLDSFSIQDAILSGKRQMEILIERNKPATFDYGRVDPIPVLHGGINTLFRPFLWKVKNLRSLLSALEIWLITLGIFFSWMRMTTSEVRYILRNPAIWVALFVCIPFFFYFTYTVNEGLIARLRVHLYPALLVLFATPILQRRAFLVALSPKSQRNTGTHSLPAVKA